MDSKLSPDANSVVTGFLNSDVRRDPGGGSIFPHSIKIGARAVGWIEDEVRNWLADRIAASRPDKTDCN
jgi:hypothetical protein